MVGAVLDAAPGGGLRQASDGRFAEYYEPFTGEPLGSMQQSWTAAAVLDWLGWSRSVRPFGQAARSGRAFGLGEPFQWREGVDQTFPLTVGEPPQYRGEIGAAGIECFVVLCAALRCDLHQDRPHIGGSRERLTRPTLSRRRMATVVVGVRTRSRAASSVILMGPLSSKVSRSEAWARVSSGREPR